MENERSDLERQYEELDRQHRSIAAKIKNLKERIRLAQQVSERDASLQSNKAPRLEAELAHAQRSRGQMLEGKERMEKECHALEDALETAQTELSSLREEWEEREREQEQLRRHIDSQGDPILRFGSDMGQLCRSIDARQWTRMPIGPLGQHIQLSEARWARAIEAHLKQTVKAFIVFSLQDGNRLWEVFEHTISRDRWRYPNIITRVPQARYNVRQPQTPAQAYRMTDLLVIRNDDVFNALVDHCDIHRVAFFEDRQTCMAAVRSGHTRDFVHCYDREGNRIDGRRGNVTFRSNRWSREPVLSNLSVDGLQRLRAAHGEKQRQAQLAKRAVDDCQRRIGEMRQRLTDKEQRMRALSEKIDRHTRTMTQLLERPRPNPDTDHDSLSYLSSSLDQFVADAAAVASKKAAVADLLSDKEREIEAARQASDNCAEDSAAHADRMNRLSVRALAWRAAIGRPSFMSSPQEVTQSLRQCAIRRAAIGQSIARMQVQLEACDRESEALQNEWCTKKQRFSEERGALPDRPTESKHELEQKYQALSASIKDCETRQAAVNAHARAQLA